MHIKTTGIVLSKRTTGENDAIVTILTDSLGVISCYLKGAARISTSTSAPMQQFCYSSLVIFKNKERYIVDSAEIIEPFIRLREDIVNLSLANYFGEITRELCSDYGSSEQLRLFLNTLYMLQTGKKDAELLKSVFEMRLLSLTGYMPDLSKCCDCGNPCDDGACFYLCDSVIRCPECTKEAGKDETENGYDRIALTPSLLAALRHIVYAPMDKLFSFTLSEGACKFLASVTERFLLTKIEHPVKTLDFYRSVLNF